MEVRRPGQKGRRSPRRSAVTELTKGWLEFALFVAILVLVTACYNLLVN